MPLHRDFKIPKRYCCDSMESTLLENDMIRYYWETREYVLVSSKFPMVESFIYYCPFCSKHIGIESVADEYWDAYNQAIFETPTLQQQDSREELEKFKIEFLVNLESKENKTNIDSNPNMT